MTALEAKQILLVLKRSKWERDLQRYGSAKTAKKIYERQNQSLERILSSHKRQLQNIDLLQKELPEANFVYQEELPFIRKEEFALLVSVGGDNHFVHVSHFAQDRPILGVNSDPETSTGALLSLHPKPACVFLNRLIRSPNWKGELAVCKWSRFGAKIDYPEGEEHSTGACISEISVRSRFHDYISRYLIRLRPALENANASPFEEHKCSGFLLATGAGSTGWYRNCLPSELQANAPFAKNAPYFCGIAREPDSALKASGRLLNPKIKQGDCLEIISEMDGEITVDADPKRVFPFPPGAVARFRLSEETLHVISPKA